MDVKNINFYEKKNIDIMGERSSLKIPGVCVTKCEGRLRRSKIEEKVYLIALRAILKATN